MEKDLPKKNQTRETFVFIVRAAQLYENRRAK